MKVLSEQRHPIKSWAVDLELEAEKQVEKLAGLPFIHSHVALMADAHAGKGSTVGTVIATKGAIIPAAVGVDIGCGMCAVRLGVDIHELGGSLQLRSLRDALEAAIPVGFHAHDRRQDEAKPFMEREDANPAFVGDERVAAKIGKQIGTLGGGNHFIEICFDESGYAWLMLHSGSRFLGKHIADFHINGAQGLMKKYFIELPDPDLAYLAEKTPEFDAYIRDMHFAQDYAKANRQHMVVSALRVLAKHLAATNSMRTEDEWHQFIVSGERIDCHHNYTTREQHGGFPVWVTRKGAVCAREGVKGIIPGSMGTRSFIVEGLGNADSFNSCSHGAGRRMSRTRARKQFTLGDFATAVQGVECSHRESVLDEHPLSYKDIDAVMAAQTDLVRPLHTLKQILCVKG